MVVSFRSVRRVALAALAVAIGFETASASSSWTAEPIERSFDVQGIPEILVRNVDGRVQIAGGEGSQVRVRAVKEVVQATSDSAAEREADKVDVRIEQSGARIEVEVFYPKTLFSFGSRPQVLVHIEIAAPAASHVDAVTVDGPLRVDGLDGDIRLKTVDGTLRARALSGRITAETVDGDLVLEEAQGSVEASSVDGDLRIDGVPQALRASSVDGNVTLRIEPGSTMDEDWSVRTVDGSVHITLPEGFAADLDLEVGDGDIEIAHEVSMTGKPSRRRFRGTLHGGGHRLHVETSDGSVTLAKS